MAVKNSIMTSHIAQNRFLTNPYAVTMLSMPIMLMCSGKLAKGNVARSIIPAIM